MSITYKNGWSVVPRGIIGARGNAGTWPESCAELRMYLVLADAAKHDGETTISNIDLMRMAGIDSRDTFNKARIALVKRGWMTAKQADARGRLYRYTIIEPASLEETATPENINVPEIVRLKDRTVQAHAFIEAATTPNLDGVKGGLVTAAAAVEAATIAETKPSPGNPPAIASARASPLAAAVTVVAKRLVDPDAAPACKPIVPAPPAIASRMVPAPKPIPVDLSGKPVFPIPPVKRREVVTA